MTPPPTGPAVVALGGGHGTAVTLRAARRYASLLTAVVSVADDGGSSGRLREILNVVALGDLRKCLVALAAEDSALARAFEHRFDEGELAGHALGNLILAGLVEATGDLVTGVRAAADLLGAEGDVLPATVERVVSLVPGDSRPPLLAVERILAADQIVIGPGSLFTSVLAAAAVGEIADAVARSSGQRVYVCNLRPQHPETAGFDVASHLEALSRHNVSVDVVLCDTSQGMPLGNMGISALDIPLTDGNALVHSPVRLAHALASLLA
jgi:2-phospho-L-lactate transferase/gluconeogenesis factor (CofD/UPF0052 family)